MSQLSLGIIETVGLAAAVEAADVCVKSADVELIGYELTKGGGMTVIKIEGDVGAVKAAVEAAKISAGKINKVVSAQVIPRPSSQIDFLIRSRDTVNSGGNTEKHEKMEKEYTCNICTDPKCPRRKGELRNTCIHYKD